MNEDDRKLNICFVSMLGYPLYNRNCVSQIFGGGAAVQLYILSKELAENENFQVNIITGNDHFTKNKIELLGKIKIFNIRPHKRKISYYFLSLLNLLITLIRIKPDVVIQRGGNKFSGICAFYCKYYKKKFLFSIANLTDVNGKHEEGFLGKFFKYGIENATHIVAQNKNQINELEKYKKRKFNNFTLIKSSYEIEDHLLTNKKHILWVARAINWKRPELFFKLAKNFSNESFVMICNKTDNKIENIKYWKTIKNKALKISNVTFIDFVPFYEINQYFKKAKIFINTSIYEGFPNTFVQAFVNKTPVISLNVNPDNILTYHKLGSYCNNDFNAMVRNLKNLLNNKDMYSQYSQNCYNYVFNNYNIKKNVKLWIQLL